MATVAGAAARLDHKVGTLTPGKEADIIVLDARALNCMPMNNAPGTVVTMMDTSNVKHVFIAGSSGSGTASWWASMWTGSATRLKRRATRCSPASSPCLSLSMA